MIEAWSVADVRAAEEPLLAAGVPLMERASFALATVVARDLARRRSVALPDGGRRDGRVTGARAVLLVGSGNNGGDTLHAGAYLARRGVEVLAVLTGEHAHAGGLAALRDAGGRVEVLVGSPDGAAHGDRRHDHLDPHVADRVAAQAARADVVLDGLVGIGARGALRGVAADLVARLAAVLDGDPAHGPEGLGRPWVVAVDAPSGIGVDDGTVPGPVLRADRTVTFGAAKPGLLLPPATHLAGHGAVVDIGLRLGAPGSHAPGPGAPAPGAHGPGAPGPGVPGPDAPAPDRGKATPVVRRLEPADVAALWSVPGATDHKYTRGVVGVVAGTPTFPGAAVLVTTAAVRTGPGMVRYGGPDDATRAVLAARPEVVPAAGRVQSWVLGPGVPAVPGPGDDPLDDGGQHERVRTALAAATATDATTTDATTTDATTTGATPERVPAVVDAGALSLLPERCPPSVVLTPHAGELATLLQARGDDVTRTDVEAEPLRWARRAHDATGATVLLKGSATVVVGPEGAWSQADAPAWLATAGAGDVLAGILGTLLAAHAERVVREPGLAARLAAAAAVVHGLAAERANPGGPVAALDVAHAVPGVVAELLAAR
ncbi:bifunctional ADP-dependent NAD(P)H-hydrate dehydratase/NAD(P)H-hydrate epimerase [Cellulosimicrobium cellulans]|uniref:bifunctional ADP-dependent NAD(P)H-hydrate dehydratase/NAD(P)H-hydrate epimerase n=1 Tax=Cellulosimicrobium cellulans TaxID=1710 RepID=UPI0020CCC4C6|nr:bifunctional ADP-dependent NAD(P)H-hydrate dehydratase/NAD(P)H-hydrate epimerase [Cellulosimicrobium cellulans]